MSSPSPTLRTDERPGIGVGDILAGRFRLVSMLGEGGMADVYEAVQLGIDRKVAVKVLRADKLGREANRVRFAREANALSQLHHPNTVTIVEYADNDGWPFLVMEFVEGEPLSNILASGEGLTLAEAVRVAQEVARALAEAHSKGIIHRDLKPENIIVTRTVDGGGPFVKVIDFGVARVDSESRRLTRAGHVCGTPEYMSPEQGRGEDVDGRSDLYALGVLLWEMVEGTVPFEAATPVRTALMHQTAPVPPLSVADAEPIEGFVARAMAKRPADRPQNAEAFLGELTEAWQQVQSTSRQRSSRGKRAAHTVRRMLVALGSSVAAATVLVGLL